MPRPSKAARAKDQQIHESLLAGHTPDEVAAQFQLAVEQVLAADRRVGERRAKQGGVEALLDEFETELTVLRRMCRREFRRAIDHPEEVSKVSGDDSSPRRKIERTFRQRRGDPQLMKMALEALNVHRQIVLLRRQETSAQDEAEAMQEARARTQANVRLMNEHTDLYLEFVRARDALMEAARENRPHIHSETLP